MEDKKPNKEDQQKQVEAAGAVGSGKPPGSLQGGKEGLANGSRETAVNAGKKA